MIASAFAMITLVGCGRNVVPAMRQNPMPVDSIGARFEMNKQARDKHFVYRARLVSKPHVGTVGVVIELFNESKTETLGMRSRPDCIPFGIRIFDPHGGMVVALSHVSLWKVPYATDYYPRIHRVSATQGILRNAKERGLGSGGTVSGGCR